METLEQELLHHAGVLKAFALRLDPSQAEDLVNDTIERMLAARDSYILGSNFRAWAFTIMRNRFYTQARRNWRMLPTDPTYLADTSAGVVEDQFDKLALKDVFQLLANRRFFSEDQAGILLAAAEGRTYDEIAEQFYIPVGTVKSVVHRMRERLRALTNGEKPPHSRAHQCS